MHYWIHGDAGTGKSTLACQLAAKHRAKTFEQVTQNGLLSTLMAADPGDWIILDGVSRGEMKWLPNFLRAISIGAGTVVRGRKDGPPTVIDPPPFLFSSINMPPLDALPGKNWKPEAAALALMDACSRKGVWDQEMDPPRKGVTVAVFATYSPWDDQAMIAAMHRRQGLRVMPIQSAIVSHRAGGL